MKSSNKIYAMYLDYRDNKDFIGMDMCRKFLEMGFTRARRYKTIIVDKSMIPVVK